MIDRDSTPSREGSVQANQLGLVSPPSEMRYRVQRPSLFDSSSLSPISSPTSVSLQLTQTISSSEGAEFMHRLVRQYCLTAYQLLVHLPDLPRTQEIFGYIPPSSSRSQIASSLCNAILADDLESLQHRAKALSSLNSPVDSGSTRSAIEGFTMGWMDVYGVQKALCEKRIRLKEDVTTSEGSRPKSASSSLIQLDVTAFINILVGQAICVGPGPAFRRDIVEYALQFATVRRP
ncbi:BZIP transcription factor [Penicillium antarcticum]|uniref:BZIP transcription factor n=1 Tax=Penicillium antarcticum TaxID=416450 RepID=UPI00238AB20A|nr:BZIP transcription factor [Penicillium antarcticum]KAJ5298019.1 BZIP transcription factor [Penicillium antarcticum]